MKKITVILSVVLVLLVGLYFWNDYKKKHTFNTVPPVTVIDGNKILVSITSTADKSIDYNNPKTLSSNSDYVIVGQVKTVDGVTNYDSKNSKYVMTSTIGNITVSKVLKGDSKIAAKDTIKFIRAGGVISVLDYSKGLSNNQIKKLGFDKLNTDEKKSEYVHEYYFNDISIEAGQKYLMYLKYNADYDRYSIIGFEYGLRQYNESTNKVKVNNTNKWEVLTDQLY